jgi:hypothetical protein
MESNNYFDSRITFNNQDGVMVKHRRLITFRMAGSIPPPDIPADKKLFGVELPLLIPEAFSFSSLDSGGGSKNSISSKTLYCLLSPGSYNTSFSSLEPQGEDFMLEKGHTNTTPKGLVHTSSFWNLQALRLLKKSQEIGINFLQDI